MGKKSKSRSEKATGSERAIATDTNSTQTADDSSSNLPFLGGSANVDPALASLFQQSAGPVKVPSFPVTGSTAPSKKATKSEDNEEDAEDEDVEESERKDGSSDADEEMHDAPEESDSSNEPASAVVEDTSETRSRKRKRGAIDDNLEESYMRRIAREEEKEKEKRREEKAKRQKVEDREGDGEQSTESEEDDTSDEDDEKMAVPTHESLTGDAQAAEVEKSNRTVFLGNVSTQAIKSKSAKKTLLRHLGSFLSTLPESSGPHKVESIRFRSTAFASGGRVPKRAAFANKEVMDETTPSTNAYAVYSTVQATRKAPAALNGTVVLDRHLRVDSVAHPAEIDHKRCVFVGNLDFVDQETSPDDEENKNKKKRSVPADVEEGLWRTFNAHTSGAKKEKGSTRGNVESVRVVRDRATRVGKGFAYVQFYDENCVEEALLLDGKKFPPMLPRKLRVVRAKKVRKRREGPEGGSTKNKALGIGEAHKTLQGRATRLFGRAGAAKLKAGETGSRSGKSLIFEGHRATEGGSSRINVKTKSRGSKGKPKTRSSRRAAAYKATGGKKAKAEK